jgi:hypothetical protein
MRIHVHAERSLFVKSFTADVTDAAHRLKVNASQVNVDRLVVAVRFATDTAGISIKEKRE